MMLMAAADEVELMHMVATQALYDEGPSAVRYPRGEAVGLALPTRARRWKLARAASSVKVAVYVC